MGGKIFETNKRIESRIQFDILHQQQLDFLSSITDKIYLPREIDSKDSFGDLDLIIPEEFIYPIAAYLEASGVPLKLLRNSNTGVIENNVISYQSDFYQVDLIFLPEDTIEYSVNYFSFGDHGNILGRLLKTIDLKNTFKGLVKDLTNNGSKKRTIILTTDYLVMLEFLKLDVSKFKEGFKNQLELFDWLSSSPYFKHDIYGFHLMSNKNRVRDKKRQFYNDFLSYLDDNSFSDSPLPLPDFTKTFPHFLIEKAAFEEEFNRHERYKEKFNGKIVSQLTGKEGIALGDLMRLIKKRLTEDMILEMSTERLHEIILKLN